MRFHRSINLKNRFALVATALSLSLVSVCPTFAITSSNSSAYNYISQFGASGSGNGEFDNPYGIAINYSTGNIYVLDTNNIRVQEFDANGTYIKQWGTYGNGAGEFNFASGLAINQSTGNIYIADGGNNRVAEYTADGTFITQWGTLGSGNGQFSNNFFVGINQSNGTVYVTDTDNYRVQAFTSNGTYITQWGSAGTGNGQFNAPFALAINNTTGNVYVTDSTNANVQEFTSSGTYITQWGTQGTANGEFNWPFNIVVNDATGNVFVSDVNNSNVQEFTSSGTYIDQFGSYGTGNGEFSNAYGLAIDQSSGTLYVTDGSDRVQKFAPTLNLAQETAPATTNLVNLSLPNGSNITSESIAPATTPYAHYNFPLGLLGFTFQTAGGASGVTVPIQITFQTDLAPSQVTPLLYNPGTQTYTTIPNASVTQTTVNGKPALLLSYSITDGGALDQDGAANGIIVDPVGLATTAAPAPQVQAPNTGYGTPGSGPIQVLGYSLFAFGLVALGIVVKRLTRLHGSNQ